MTDRNNFYRKPVNRIHVSDEFDNRPADKQINKIIAIAKYKFKWGRKALFNYICESVKDCGLRISIEDGKHYKYSALLNALSTDEKSTVIKRLEQIEKRNDAAALKAIEQNLNAEVI